MVRNVAVGLHMRPQWIQRRVGGPARRGQVVPPPISAVSKPLPARWFRQAVAVRVLDGLSAVPYRGLGEQPVDVRLHGGLADEEPPGDLAVGQTVGDQPQYLGLARRQAVRKATI